MVDIFQLHNNCYKLGESFAKIKEQDKITCEREAEHDSAPDGDYLPRVESNAKNNYENLKLFQLS